MAASFLTNHPAATTITGDMWTNNGTPLWNDFKSVYKQVNPSDATPAIQDQAFEEAQAYILDAYNTGIGLFKLDANGNFKEVHTVKSTDANGQATYSKFNCN
jgi:hypothetical protein